MKKLLLISLTLFLFSCSPPNKEESLRIVKETFPNHEIYKAGSYEFILKDSSGNILVVKCLNLSDDGISRVSKLEKIK